MKWLIGSFAYFALSVFAASSANAALIYWSFSGSNGTESVSGVMSYDTPGSPTGFVPFGHRRNFVDQATLTWTLSGGIFDGDSDTRTDHDIYLDTGFSGASRLNATGGAATDAASVAFHSGTIFLWGPNAETLPSGPYTIDQFTIARNFSRTIGSNTINITLDTLTVGSTPVPEPSVALLFAGGLAALAARKHSSRGR